MASAIPGDGEASTALQATKAALALATLTVGATTLVAPPPPDELGAFIAACEGFGALVRTDAATMTVQGVGIGGLARPAVAVGHGEDAFGTALLAGLAGGHDCGAQVAMTDAMAVALAPVLAATGATIGAASGVPGVFDIRGARDPLPVDHATVASPVSAVSAAFAALNAAGATTLRGAGPLPGCIEVLFGRFGVELAASAPGGAATRDLRIAGRPELRPARIDLTELVAGPGRPS